MGFVDDMRVAASGAADAAGNAASTARVRLELSDLNRRRQGLMAQLGEAVYERTRDDAAAREADEPIYAAIESLDARRIELQGAIKSLERQRETGTTARTTPPTHHAAGAGTMSTCPACGAAVEAGDLFCVECGTRLEDVTERDEAMSEATTDEPVVPTEAGLRCPSCGSPVEEGDRFCLECGARLDGLRGTVGETPDARVFEAVGEAEPSQDALAEVSLQTDVVGDEGKDIDVGADVPTFDPVPRVAGAEDLPGGRTMVAEPVEADKVPQVEKTSMRFCIGCGRPLKPTDAFCGWCGMRAVK